jgi:hypothetical protein
VLLQNALDSKFHQAPLETMQAVNQRSSPEGQFNLFLSRFGMVITEVIGVIPDLSI